MPLIMAIDDIKPEQIRSRRAKNGGTHTTFIQPTDDHPDYPSAFLVTFTPGGSLVAHYHHVDQFQVLVKGEGTFGRHHVAPYYVHFARGLTPYGPLHSEGGWAFLTLRMSYDPGTQSDFETLKQVPERQPWQVAVQVVFPSPGAAAVLARVPEISNDQGLYVSTLTVPPHGRVTAPDPCDGSGQYIAAVKGSLMHEGREHKALAVVFVSAAEAAYKIQAGAEGLDALVLNFPRVAAPAVREQPSSSRSVAGSRKWQCVLCAFAYDEALGMPAEGIAPGTRWQDVPDHWSCPDCAASKSDFEMVEVEMA
jgi:rubredoxin